MSKGKTTTQHMNTITTTNFNFPNQKSVYRGKVREVYNINDDLLVMVATDRLSAFDVVLPKGIPYKGQILNQIATKFMELTSDIVPNWLVATPDPNVAVGHLCEPFKVEMVIRGYLSGHAAREYAAGRRILCGVTMPEGLKEAHRLNDEAVERCYRSTPFNNDEERLEYLFKLYEKMIQEEKEKGSLFAVEKKIRKKK